MNKTADSQQKIVLVVEDEPAISTICQRVLSGEGYAVDIAVNGVVAQGMIAGRYYDLCLIDIRTPAMNGRQLYQWLKEKHPQLADRVVFTTGDFLGGEIHNWVEESGLPFLAKPFTPGELRTIIREALKAFNSQA